MSINSMRPKVAVLARGGLTACLSAAIAAKNTLTGAGMEYQLEVLSEVTVVTANSIYLVRPQTYIRMPRHEESRPQPYSLDGKLKDNEWFTHDGVWVMTNDDDPWRLRILPSGRFEGARGLITSDVEAIFEKV